MFTPKEAAKILGVHVSSLRRWENEGKLRAIRTPGGQRRFVLDEVEKIGGMPKTIRTVGYGRVSTHGQQEDLQRQLETYAQDVQRQKSFQKLAVDSILDGKNSSPFWNESSMVISNVLSLPILTDSLDSGTNWLSGYAKNLSVNSWFSMTANSLLNQNSYKISCPSSILSLHGYTDLENTNPSSKKTYKQKTRHSRSKSTKPQPNSVRKIRLYPSKELHKVWKRWLAQYRYYYNESISLLRCLDGIEKCSAESLDKILQQLENIPDWVKTIPGHQRQEACFEAYDAFHRAKKDGGGKRQGGRVQGAGGRGRGRGAGEREEGRGKREETGTNILPLAPCPLPPASSGQGRHRTHSKIVSAP